MLNILRKIALYLITKTTSTFKEMFVVHLIVTIGISYFSFERGIVASLFSTILSSFSFCLIYFGFLYYAHYKCKVDVRDDIIKQEDFPNPEVLSLFTFKIASPFLFLSLFIT